MISRTGTTSISHNGDATAEGQACMPRGASEYLNLFYRAKNYFLFNKRSAAPMVAIIPSSIPNGAVVLAVATGAGLAVVSIGAVITGVVVTGIATSLAE